MTALRPRRCDAWLFPPGIRPPGAWEDTPVGGAVLRYPKSDHHLAGKLIAALRASRSGLAALRTRKLTRILGGIGERFADTLDPEAVAEVAANARLSPPMTREAVAGMAASWTARALARLVRAEFPDMRVLDEFVAENGRKIRASGPAVTLHFGAGSVPGVTITSMLRALLVRSPVLVKPGAGDAALTTRFARELHRADPRLAAAVAVHYWPGGAPARAAWERDLLTLADQVVVYGGDDAIESVRARAPASTRLVEHPHRLGVAVVDPGTAPGSAADAARAVSMFEQRGCVSTHLVLLLGGHATARAWCGRLATRLAETAAVLPAAPPTAARSSARHQLRGRLALGAAASGEAALWAPEGADWTVALAPADAFEPVGGRTVWVSAVSGLAACIEILAPLSPVLQTVGLAGTGALSGRFAEALFALGATRMVPLHEVPFPGPEWLHDGSRPLRELVCWGELR